MKEWSGSRGSTDGVDAAAVLLERVVALAREAVREARLPSHLADDLAQEAMVELLANDLGACSDDVIACTVRRVASREGSRRRRERRRAAGARETDGATLPALCPRLEMLTAHASDRRRYARGLTDAAHLVAADPAVLADHQFRLYQLAHIQAYPSERLTTLLRISTPTATRKRLYRVSRRVERGVVAAVTPLLPARSLGVAFRALEPGFSGKKTEKALSAELNRTCDALTIAFQQVVHRNPGRGVT